MTGTGRRIAFLAVGSAVAALACAAPTPSPPAPGSDVEVVRSALTTNVTITVLDTSGVPQTGSTVYAEHTNGTVVKSAAVDTNGHAVIALTSATYKFAVQGSPSGSGFSYFSSNCVVPSCVSASVTVQKPVQVTVLDGWGNPAAGVHVEADDASGNPDNLGDTDDSGQLTLSTDPGTYQFQADYGGTFFDSDPCTVPGCTSTSIQLQKPVQVTVDDGYGGPRPDIQLAAVDTNGNEVSWATTDDSGQASIYMPPGAYFIQAEASDGTTFDSGPSGSCVVPGCTSASVSVTDVIVTVTYSDGSPVTNQRVTAVTSDGTEVDWPTTDDQGQADAFVNACGYKFFVVLDGTEFDSGPDGSCVVPGCRTAVINVPEAPVVVTVVDGSGQPIANQDVTAHASGGTTCDQTTDANGQTTFVLSNDSYRFSASCGSETFYSGDPGSCVVPGCSTARITMICGGCTGKPNGTACNDGDACTQTDTCQSGACVGGNPITCAASDQCHAAGSCDPATGTCSSPSKADGTACNDGNACTQTDTCQSGTCTGGNPVTCVASDQCHVAGTCSPSTGVCSNPTAANGTACSDGNACTVADACQSGTCTGTTVTCTAQDQCHSAGTCNPSTGTCSNPIAADGTTCNDGNACTLTDTCEGGSCVGGNPVTCPPLGQCQTAGTCNPSTGTCSNVNLADGTPCNDGNACTTGEICEGGACTSGTAVTCVAPDGCHAQGFCDATTGSCTGQVAQPDGTPCAGGVCMSATCQAVSAGSAVPTPLDPTVPVDIQSSTAFLYSGSSASQIGVQPGTMVQNRAAVLRGRVLDTAGNGVQGASVLVVGRPEYGVTVTGPDGIFSMAANGGELLRLQYQAQGYLSVRRTSFVADLDYSWFPDVTLTVLDPAKTTINLAGTSATTQVAIASPVSDLAGTRQSVLLFPPGLQASIEQTDGTSTPVNSLTVHSTEYTVGVQGPSAMPAALPPFSGYTYAVDLSAEEATGGDVTRVAFSQPVVNYVDNFLSFPAGSVVPVAYLDPVGGDWIPSTAGVVLTVLSTSGGTATIDSNGDGVADSISALTALGVTEAELTAIASLYQPGQSLWRVPVTHFTKFDFNWPISDPGAQPPNPPNVQPPNSNDPNTCPQSGASTIDCVNRAITETVAVVGTPYTLTYSSARVPGYAQGARSLTIPVSGPSLDPSLEAIQLTIAIAGQQVVQVLPPTPNQIAHFTWDGRDGFGREVFGSYFARLVVDFLYSAAYLPPSSVSPWDVPPPPPTTPIVGAFIGRATVGLEGNTSVVLTNTSSKSQDGFGGWSLSNHHSYDPRTFKLTRGDGTVAAALPVGLNPISIKGGPSLLGDDVLPAPDGTFYVSDEFSFGTGGIGPNIIKVDPSGGTVTTVAAGIQPTFLSADGPSIVFTHQVQPFPNDPSNVGTIERVNADGSISQVAGDPSAADCPSPPSGDDGPAAAACLGFINGVAVAPDHQIYFVDGSLRKIDSGGIVRNMLAPSITSAYELAFVTVAPDYSIFMSMVPTASANKPNAPNRVVKKLLSDGTLQHVAGVESGPESCSDGDGSGGVRVSMCGGLQLAVGPDGSLYTLSRLSFPFGSTTETRGAITKIQSDGTVAEMFPGLVGLNVILLKVTANGQFLVYAQTPSSDPSNGIYWGDENVFLLGPSTPGVGAATVFSVPSAEGREIYQFDGSGRHQTTYDGLTSAVKYQFGYDSAGYVTTVTDATGLVTSVVRDGAEVPSAIVSPTGQTTSFGIDPNGYLASITSPGGAQYQFTYQDDGLMNQEIDPRAGVHAFTYDSVTGRLLSDQTPIGGGWSLAQSGSSGATDVVLTSATGLNSTMASMAPFGAQATNGTVSMGNRTFAVTRPNGLTATTSIDSQGNSVMTAADGTVSQTTAAADPRFGMAAPYIAARVLSTSGGLARVETRARSVTLASDGVTLASQVDSTTVNGQTTTNSYDGSSRTSTVTSPAGRQSIRSIDAAGRTASIQKGGLAPASFGYDARGRLTTVTTGVGTEARVTALTYDSLDRPSTFTGPIGSPVGLAFDGDDRPISESLSGGPPVSQTYDSAGDLLSFSPPDGLQHRFTYTAAGDLASYTAPTVDSNSTTTVYGYDLDRRMTSAAFPDGRTVTFAYDSAGRLAGTTSPDGTVSYLYSPTTGHLSRGIAMDGGTVDFTNDGRLITQMTWNGTVSGSVSRSFDNNFRLATETVNTGTATAISYDPDGLVVGYGALVITRDASSGLPTATSLGAVNDSRTYDEFGDVMTYGASFGTDALLSQAFVRDNGGRIMEMVETLSGNSTTYDYGYDSMGQLTSVSANGAVMSTYAYDANGNRLSKGTVGGSDIGSYDGQDRLLSYGKWVFTYTPTGDLLTKTDTTSGAVTTYKYDVFGNLLRVSLPNGSVVSYVIDAFGKRIGKKVNGVLVKGWLYSDGLMPVAELDGSGALITQFVGRDALIQGGVTYRVIRDHVGSPRLIVNGATGAIAENISYDEFGVVLADSAPGFQPIGFSGGIYDSDTGLVRFGARDYDPNVGRWTSKDPARFKAGDPNLYRYVVDDPINISDPRGLAVSVCHQSSSIQGLPGWVWFVLWLSTIDTDHYWIKTDTNQFSIANAPGAPDEWGAPMTQFDENNAELKPDATCSPVPDANEQCVDDSFSPGASAGNFSWPSNTCQSFVQGVLEKCGSQWPYNPYGFAND